MTISHTVAPKGFRCDTKKRFYSCHSSVFRGVG